MDKLEREDATRWHVADVLLDTQFKLVSSTVEELEITRGRSGRFRPVGISLITVILYVVHRRGQPRPFLAVYVARMVSVANTNFKLAVQPWSQGECYRALEQY